MIEQFCDWLSSTRLSLAFQTADWFVPAVQTIHILAIGMLLVASFLVAFKIMGFGKESIDAVVARHMPWIWSALLVLLLTGSLLTITEPARELLNWVFRTKMLLVLTLAALLVAVQHSARKPVGASAPATGRGTRRTIGCAILAIGCCIVVAGRWIAYA